MIRYLISSGAAMRDPAQWLAAIAYWIEAGIDFVQIREPEMDIRQLAELTRCVLRSRAPESRTKVLVNDRADVAIATGADGVHLRDGSVEAKRIKSIARRDFVVSVACHDRAGVISAEKAGADYIVLAPVFEPLSKSSSRPLLGLNQLRDAAASVGVPVIALGGITEANAHSCIQAGAAGVAGISLFAPRNLR